MGRPWRRRNKTHLRNGRVYGGWENALHGDGGTNGFAGGGKIRFYCTSLLAHRTPRFPCPFRFVRSVLIVCSGPAIPNFDRLSWNENQFAKVSCSPPSHRSRTLQVLTGSPQNISILGPNLSTKYLLTSHTPRSSSTPLGPVCWAGPGVLKEAHIKLLFSWPRTTPARDPAGIKDEKKRGANRENGEWRTTKSPNRLDDLTNENRKKSVFFAEL